jgi:hypothetical protein
MPATWPAWPPRELAPPDPPPLPPASGDVIEADRTVNASGSVSPGDHIISAGLPLTGPLAATSDGTRHRTTAGDPRPAGPGTER